MQLYIDTNNKIDLPCIWLSEPPDVAIKRYVNRLDIEQVCPFLISLVDFYSHVYSSS